MAMAVSSPPEQGQLVTVRQRRYVVTDVAKSTLPDRPLNISGNGGQHLVSVSSVEDDAPWLLRRMNEPEGATPYA